MQAVSIHVVDVTHVVCRSPTHERLRNMEFRGKVFEADLISALGHWI
jgi:hypothetical protein